ncbi:MAG: hypothetical protein HYX37_10525 [Rhizobiales bacterium]|nr:hypothetical protein [Hyphomicrobiales bacterium]
MSTFSLHAAHVPTFPGLVRFIAALAIVLDVFVEAQDAARAAHKRLPFVDW